MTSKWSDPLTTVLDLLGREKEKKLFVLHLAMEMQKAGNFQGMWSCENTEEEGQNAKWPLATKQY